MLPLRQAKSNKGNEKKQAIKKQRKEATNKMKGSCNEESKKAAKQKHEASKIATKHIARMLADEEMSMQVSKCKQVQN